MTRALLGVIFISLLITITTGQVFADRFLVLECVDDNNQELRYEATGIDYGTSWDIMFGYDIYVEYDCWLPGFSFDSKSTELGFPEDNSTLVGPNGVLINAVGNPFPPVSIPDGSVLATFNCPGQLVMSINYDNPLFQVEFETGTQLNNAGRLYPISGGLEPCACGCGAHGGHVTTGDATNINTNSATLHGMAYDWEFESAKTAFIYGTNAGGPYTNQTEIKMTGDGPFNSSIGGLSAGQTYYYRTEGYFDFDAYYIGNEKSFTTPCTQTRSVTALGLIDFGCADATINVTSLSSPGEITITVHPDDYHTAGVEDSVKRWFEIQSTASGTFNLTLSYDESELETEIEGNLCLWRYDGNWDGPFIGIVDTVNNTVTVNDITQFSDWIIADENGPQPPVPEIITIVLLSLGVLALVGYICYRRYVYAT